MSAEHRLNGLYGKHPAFGDFIQAGLGEPAQALGDWAQAALGEWREGVGPDWQARFDAAPALAFWIGPALLGAPLRGVMAPSRDRTGRRFPLMVAQAGGAAPVIQSEPEFYVAAGHALAGLLSAEGFDPRDAALALDLPAPQGAMPDWPTFWALNPALGADALIGQLAAADHAHATAARSYWWFDTSDGASGVLCCQGWPNAGELGWLLAAGQVERAEA